MKDTVFVGLLIVAFGLGWILSPDNSARITMLETELQKIKAEKSATQVCEDNLKRIADKLETLSLSELQSGQRRCNAERLAEFRSTFPEVETRIRTLEKEEIKQREKEQVEKIAAKLKKEREEEIRSARDGAHWESTTSTNQMSDTTDIYLRVKSNAYYRKFGPGHAELTIRCKEDTTALVLNFGEYLGDDSLSVYEDWKNVTMRLDKNPPVTRRMDVATNNEAVGFWNGGQSIPFIKKMLGAEQLVVRITPYGENSREMVFPVSGLEHFIEPLRRNCGW